MMESYSERIERQFGAICRAYFVEKMQNRSPKLRLFAIAREMGISHHEVMRIRRKAIHSVNYKATFGSWSRAPMLTSHDLMKKQAA